MPDRSRFDAPSAPVSSAPPYVAREVTTNDARALAAFFDGHSSGCYCRYWHFEGDKNEWLERTALHADENREDLLAALARSSPEATGIVAVNGASDVVGWLKLTPAVHATKAYQQRYYKSLPCFDGDRDGVHLVACMLVDPSQRRRGVARALVTEALAVARLWGAKAIEAFPRRPLERVTDEELWMGPLSVFAELGFVAVHRAGDAPTGNPDPYPVLRFDVSRHG